MAEPVEAAAEPVVEKTAPVINPNRPLNQQIDKMLEAVPEKDAKTEDKADDKPKSDESDKDKAADSDKDDDKKAKDDEAKPDNVEPDEDEPAPVVELPPIAKYVMDRLPNIQAFGHTPGKTDKMVSVKRAEDLPAGFEFAGGREAERAFDRAHNANELTARDLLREYQVQEQKQQYDNLKTQEAKDIQSDLKELQRDGMLAKFKYSENDSRFNDDPAVKEANEIHKLYEATNQNYLNRKMNYRISFRDAADKYYAQQSRKPVEDKKNDEPKKSAEDVERERGAHKVTARTGADSTTPTRMPAGSTTRDILRLLDQGRI